MVGDVWSIALLDLPELEVAESGCPRYAQSIVTLCKTFSLDGR